MCNSCNGGCRGLLNILFGQCCQGRSNGGCGCNNGCGGSGRSGCGCNGQQSNGCGCGAGRSNNGCGCYDAYYAAQYALNGCGCPCGGSYSAVSALTPDGYGYFTASGSAVYGSSCGCNVCG